MEYIMQQNLTIGNVLKKLTVEDGVKGADLS